jgi:hypothetical protein
MDCGDQDCRSNATQRIGLAARAKAMERDRSSISSTQGHSLIMTQRQYLPEEPYAECGKDGQECGSPSQSRSRTSAFE